MKIVDQIAVNLFCGDQVQGAIRMGHYTTESITENTRLLAEVLVGEAEDRKIAEEEFRVAVALLCGCCGPFVIGAQATPGNFEIKANEAVDRAIAACRVLVEKDGEPVVEDDPQVPAADTGDKTADDGEDSGAGGEEVVQEQSQEDKPADPGSEKPPEPTSIATQKLSEKKIPDNIIDKLLSTNLHSVESIIAYDKETQKLDKLGLIGDKIRLKILEACGQLLEESKTAE